MNTTWKLDDLYNDINDPQIQKDIDETAKKAEAFIKKWKNNKEYTKNPEVLLEALIEYENIPYANGLFSKIIYYLFLRISLDQTNKELTAKDNQITDIETDLWNRMQFFELNLGKIPKSKQSEFLNYKGLQGYRHYLERTFQTAKYNLSDKEEKIVNILSKSGTSNWANMLEEFISKETKKLNGKENTFEELMTLTRDKDKKVRNEAGKAIDSILNKWVDVAEHEINSIVEVRKNIGKLRKYKSVDSSRHLADDIETSVVHAMKDAVTEGFNISHRFYSLLTKLLNLEKIGYHEKATTYGEIRSTFEYDKGFERVKKVYTKLDTELGDFVNSMNKEKRIDVYPAKGKSGGAFCIGYGAKLPIYVLLNYDNRVNDVTTLAHELGHAVNNYLLYKTQKLRVNAHTTVATAEVASTFFEDFALDSIIEEANDDEKFAILVKKVQDDVSKIFRQVACYNFELELHNSIKEKGYLSKVQIGEIFEKHMTAYLGDSVKFSKKHRNWWVYWSHIRRPFYVYSYASGLLISKSLQNMVKSDPKNIEKVKRFLSSGTSKSPKDIFAELGIDITNPQFWKDGLKEIEIKLTELETMAKKMGKIK